MNRMTSVVPVMAIALAAGCGGAASTRIAPAPGPISLAEPEYSGAPREQTADQQVRHVLSRLTFGARPGDVEKVRAMGVDRWIDLQLHPDRIDNSAAERYAATFETNSASAAELAQKYPRPQQVLARLGARGDRSKLSAEDSVKLREMAGGLRRVGADLQASRVARASLSERQLDEVMTDFWLNHFNVYIQKGGPEPYLIADFENNAIRPNALGHFRTLLEAVAKSPAMLFYLDNWQSQADSTRPHLSGGNNQQRARRYATQQPAQVANRRRGGLNENYGRELLELHTLGVDGGYTQTDVINVARALTGWTIKQPQQGGDFQFMAQLHDAGNKVVLGHKLAANRGIEDGEDVLDIVSRHPATAHYIAFKLARHFVSDVPPAGLVDRAAATFTRTNGDIREVVRTIVTSPEFFSGTAYQSKVKSPFEVVTSALRALGAQPDNTPRTAQFVAALGQPIYGHQAPNGWPDTGDQWMNTGAILNRINFGIAVAANRVPGVSATGFSGADALRNAPLDQQVEGVVQALLGGHVSTDTRAILTSGENPFLNSAAALDSNGMMKPPPVDDPDLGLMVPPMARDGRAQQAQKGVKPALRAAPFTQAPQLKGLPQIVGLALGSPEFQRR
jgi:uncharacterized protein (DUF1800 family)